MRAELFNLIAMQMNQSAAFFAFAVIAGHMGVVSHSAEFKTGGTVCVYDVLVHNSLIHQTVKLAVNGGRGNRSALFPEVIADILDSDMAAFHLFKKCGDFRIVFCCISGFVIHKTPKSKMKTIFNFMYECICSQVKRK
jgi:hypothetical protein